MEESTGRKWVKSLLGAAMLLYCLFVEMCIMGSSIGHTTGQISTSLPDNVTFTLFYLPDMLENSDIVLRSPITQNYLSHFSNPLQFAVIQGRLQHCPHQALCTFAWPGRFEEPFSSPFCCSDCSCSDKCEEDMNCCPDKIPEEYFNINQTPNYKQCMTLTLKGTYLEGVYAYKTCPSEAEESEKHKCVRNYWEETLSVRDVVPVTDEYMTTYRNIHCATCNGVGSELTSLAFWIPMIQCEDGEILFKTEAGMLNAVFERSDCNIEFSKPSNETVGIASKCTPIISTCNVTGLWEEYDEFLEWACALYISPVKQNLHDFNNVFCMLCNGMKKRETFCDSSSNDKMEISHTFAVLLNVAEYETLDTSEPCPTGFLKVQDDCLEASCSSLRVFQGDKCIRVIDDVQHMQYLVHFRLVPVEQGLSTKIVTNSLASVRRHVMYLVHFSGSGHVKIDAVDLILHTNLAFRRNISVSELQNATIQYCDIRLQYVIQSSHNPENILSLFRNISGQIENISLDFNQSISNQFVLLLKDDTGEQFDMITTNRALDFNTSAVFDMDIVAGFNTDTSSTMIPFAFEQNIISNIRYSNIMSMRDCPFVEISKSDIDWKETKNGIAFQDEVLTLPFADFMYSKNNSNAISICFETYMKLHKYISSDQTPVSILQKIEFIISVVCVSLSIVSLIVTCVTFLILPSFKSLPWRNNFALCLTLLFVQSLYLIGTFGEHNTHSIACKIISVMLHFFLLMFIFWMHICTFHMYRVLSRTKLLSSGSKWRRLIIYIVYSLIMSSIFVLVNVLVNVFGGTGKGIGYGETICYINSQKMVMLTFGLPLAFVIVSNLIMVIRVIWKVKETSNVQKNVKNERNLLVIFAKLSVITGLTWIFGLIYMFTNLSVFALIFIAVNGSQGVFMMVSFVINKKVLMMYEGRFSSTFSGTLHSSTNTH